MTGSKNHRIAVEFLDEIMIIRLLDREIGQGFGEPDDVGVIAEQIDHLVEAARSKDLLLDLSEVEFMASRMQADLLTLQKKLRLAGGRLKLFGLGERIAHLFHFTGLDKSFADYRDEQSALDAFDAGR